MSRQTRCWRASLPTFRQRRSALIVALVMIAVFWITLPFGAVQLPRDGAIVTSILSIYATNNAITAVLLYSQFSISRSLSILMLASGYLLASLMAVPWASYVSRMSSYVGRAFWCGATDHGLDLSFLRTRVFHLDAGLCRSQRRPITAGRRAPGSVSLAIGGSTAGAFVSGVYFHMVSDRGCPQDPAASCFWTSITTLRR